MTVHIHPSVDNGVKKGSGGFASGIFQNALNLARASQSYFG
jgi:hypothetical protein